MEFNSNFTYATGCNSGESVYHKNLFIYSASEFVTS
jgi:hypothetical protein